MFASSEVGTYQAWTQQRNPLVKEIIALVKCEWWWTLKPPNALCSSNHVWIQSLWFPSRISAGGLPSFEPSFASPKAWSSGYPSVFKAVLVRGLRPFHSLPQNQQPPTEMKAKWRSLRQTDKLFADVEPAAT